ncbi:helical backbone metal receptor [Janibacter cremeus]|uniref:ABC-type Fe3+-hydroxamate transport system substrate-binding protein n=1 Tax=Janibacter cremeus TaxID=1285192 RepID=A0A852VWP9_9MICO|nr:helical backbone metal receptor [Janibacter cremeus]NYF98674.1 ABC-type Fe3+-hydroxamate transport system substrate-binding protein [Janibacter cremeus]
MPTDDLGATLEPGPPPQRVVSLVPSLTEAIAASCPGVLVGATDWCTHPGDLDVTRARGTKNPNLKVIAGLEPDLVVVNKEENRELDVRRMRDRGIPVWVTDIEDVPSALTSMRRLFVEALQQPVPDWLEHAEELWGTPPPTPRGRLVVPIWRDPWMVVGPRTYTTDLLSRLGWSNAYAGPDADPDKRYPHVDLADIDRDDVDLVLLPDEPYEFTVDDGPEAFVQAPTRLVSGRLLTWYGPAMVEAYETLARE